MGYTQLLTQRLIGTSLHVWRTMVSNSDWLHSPTVQYDIHQTSTIICYFNYCTPYITLYWQSSRVIKHNLPYYTVYYTVLMDYWGKDQIIALSLSTSNWHCKEKPALFDMTNIMTIVTCLLYRWEWIQWNN